MFFVVFLVLRAYLRILLSKAVMTILSLSPLAVLVTSWYESFLFLVLSECEMFLLILFSDSGWFLVDFLLINWLRKD